MMNAVSILEGLPVPVKKGSLRQVGRRLFLRGTKIEELRESVLELGGSPLKIDSPWYYLLGKSPRVWRGRLLSPWVRSHADFPKSTGELILAPMHVKPPPSRSYVFQCGALYIEHPLREGKIRVSRHALCESFPSRVRSEPWPKIKDFSEESLAKGLAAIVKHAEPITRVNKEMAQARHGKKATYWLSKGWVLVLSEKEDTLITIYRRRLGSLYRKAG